MCQAVCVSQGQTEKLVGSKAGRELQMSTTLWLLPIVNKYLSTCEVAVSPPHWWVGCINLLIKIYAALRDEG